MNKKLLSIVLALLGGVAPFTSAKENIGVSTQENSLIIVENPFPELKQGYSFDSRDDYSKAIETIYKEHTNKFSNLRNSANELNSYEEEFKCFCDEILKRKSENDEDGDDYLIYRPKWKEYISDCKSKLAKYFEEIDDSVKTAKELVLLIESYKCFGIDSDHCKGMNTMLKQIRQCLNYSFASKHYCNAWLDYAKENAELSVWTINSIDEYPIFYDSMMKTKNEFNAWYDDLFTNKK